MSKQQDTESIRINQVMAGALAAVTAALLGSTLGVAGTVLGAGLASVVSTVGAALYLRSIQRTGQGVRSVRDRAVARTGSTAGAPAEQEPDESDEDVAARRPQAGRIGRPGMIVGSVLAFALGMVVVTGVEWLRGEPLSGGEGTTVGGIVRTHPGGADKRDKSPVTSDPSTPPSAGDRTVTVTPTPTPTSATPEPPDPSGESSTPVPTPSSSPSSGGSSSPTPG
jgi:hypothetical protein